MKGGRTPIHIQRWAPADFQRDEHVEFMLFARDFRSYTFYRQFLDVSFMAGGDLPSEPSRLCACLHMRPADVQHGLAFCLGRLIEERDGRLFQKRVAAEVAEEIAFRESQAEHGRLGGRPKKKGYPLANGKATLSQTLSESESPPAPSASALRLAPAPTPEEKASPSSRSRSDSGPPEQTDDPPLLEFPCDGEPRAWQLRRSKVLEWSECYPALDILAECRRALQWIRDDPSRRKTARGMTKFLGGWLGKSQNQGAGRNGAPRPLPLLLPLTAPELSPGGNCARHPSDPDTWLTRGQWANAHPDEPYPERAR